MGNTPAPAPSRNQPVHEVRLGTVKAAIWQNDTDAGVRYNVTLERLYRDGDEWKSTQSFGRDDLLLVAKVSDLAHSWIMNPEPVEARPAERPKRSGATDLTDKAMPKRPSQAKAGS